jgi:hypothetical protein
MAWGDFLRFLGLFYVQKGDVAWDDVACYLNFQNYFSMEKGDVARGYFFEIFFNEERWHGIRWCDMLLEFLDFFSMKKDDMAWHAYMLRELKLMTCTGS